MIKSYLKVYKVTCDCGGERDYVLQNEEVLGYFCNGCRDSKQVDKLEIKR